MAYTELDDTLAVTKYRSKYWSEYVRMGGYKPYMGAGANSIITTLMELTDGGKDMILPLLGSLSGQGVGTALLVGSEEKLANFPFRTRPVWRRNAVIIKKSTIQKSNIELLEANKDALTIWSSDDMRRRVGQAFTTVAIDDTIYSEDMGAQNSVFYANATATQRNNYLLDNTNRVLFGASAANLVAGNYVNSLLNVSTGTGSWSAAMIDAMVDMAEYRDETLTPQRRAIRPYRVPDETGGDQYVLFVGSRTFNKLKADADIKVFNKDSRERTVQSNPYFNGSDLIWNNTIIHKVPEQRFVLAGVGAAGADVEMGFFCGAQALAVAWGQSPITTKRMDDDYGFIKGVGTEELRSIDKTFFKEAGAVGPGTQWGMITGHGAV